MLLTVSPNPSSNTFKVVTLTILANDADFVGLFDSIEVWRSRDTESGPYEELTGPAWAGARLPRTGGDQPSSPQAGPDANVVGLMLELIINEQDLLEVTFSGSNPLTLAQAASQIQTASLGRLRSWVDMNGQLVVETTEPGTGATLRVIASDAASFLGLPLTLPDSFSFGREARLMAMPGVETYTFRDKSGATNYFYKTRYSSKINNTASEFSQAYSAAQPLGVDPATVVVGYLDLIDSAGRPLTGIEVSLRSPFVGQLIADKLVAGQDLMKKTDVNGHVEFTLVRGQTYALAISGTNIAKQIVTPTDVSIESFLLVDDAFATEDDYFRARIPQIPTAARRSL